VSRHVCPGEGCSRCERRIEQIEYERDAAPVDEYPPGLDWAWPIGVDYGRA
jgi:hypothetical protein